VQLRKIRLQCQRLADSPRQIAQHER
jgi:hypothetical protein